MIARTVLAEPLSWGDDVLDAAILAAVKVLRDAGSVLVVGHERPDGDAIGSTLGAAAVARGLGCSVTTFNVDSVPSNLQFLPGAREIVHEIAGQVFDVTIMVDCGERHRVGERFPDNGWADNVICLDHHKSFDPDVANIICRDPSAPATAEIVYRLMSAAGVALEPDAASALFCALLTDTGSFRYGATTSHAMELGERLLRTGIDVWRISSEVYESNSVERVRLTARALDSLALHCEGRLAMLTLCEADFASSGASSDHADGLINFARGIAGVQVAAQLTEDGAGFRVSLRSRGQVDVSLIGERFGGGGHKNAAGCRIDGSASGVSALLSAAVTEVLDGATAEA